VGRQRHSRSSLDPDRELIRPDAIVATFACLSRTASIKAQDPDSLTLRRTPMSTSRMRLPHRRRLAALAGLAMAATVGGVLVALPGSAPPATAAGAKAPARSAAVTVGDITPGPALAANTLVVNANDDMRPVTHVASGGLYGLAARRGGPLRGALSAWTAPTTSPPAMARRSPSRARARGRAHRRPLPRRATRRASYGASSAPEPVTTRSSTMPTGCCWAPAPTPPRRSPS
jgi:hypothetical protein